MIENDADLEANFQKQFSDIISKKLKRKLKPMEDLAAKRSQFSQRTILKGKRTLVIDIDDCILKTSIFSKEFPRNDSKFIFQNLKVFVCFRKHLEAFLKIASEAYELIAWTSA